MASTSTFVVNNATKEFEHIKANPREYWNKGGEFEGEAETIIEVFGDNQEKEAKILYDALKKAGLSDRYSEISVKLK